MYLRREIASLAAVCARQEQARFGLTCCVRLRLQPDGFYRCDATDGRRLLIVRGPNADPDGNFPVGRDVFIPAADWKAVFRLGTKKGTPKVHPVVRVTWEDKTEMVPAPPAKEGDPPGEMEVHTFAVVFSDLAGAEQVRVEQTPEMERGRFPNVDAVLPKGGPLIKVAVNPDLVAETLKAVGAFATDESNRVVMGFFGATVAKVAQVPFGVCTSNEESGLTVDGLLVPLVDRETIPLPAGGRSCK